MRPTIVGVATGTPDGGVAVVRLSGATATSLATQVVGNLGPPRRLVRRALAFGDGTHDDVLVVWMPGPRSLTGEDVVELHVHAGTRNVRAVVEVLRSLGAVAAGPGEFMRRAFELGRVGLDQAEGVAVLISADTDAALAHARRLVAGELGREVAAVTDQLHALRCEVEAHLDFPEDVEDTAQERWRTELQVLAAEVRRWCERFAAGRHARERPRIVLAGPPNAGKSSILNALLGRQRSIVSADAGTTRDYVEVEWRLGARECVLVDTAGLRVAGDLVEAAGVGLSREQIDGADLIVWVEAADAGPAELVPDVGELLRVENKIDVGRQRSDWLGVSAVGELGISPLREALVEWDLSRTRDPWIGLARHHDCAAEAVEALDEANALVSVAPLEVVAFQLMVAERRLREIGGRSSVGPVGEEVLASIFSRFCIGK